MLFSLFLMLRPATIANTILRMVAGIKGKRQVAAATVKGTFCRKAKKAVPNSRFIRLPVSKANTKKLLRRGQYRIPRPVSQAMRGKVQRKPPVGAKRHCRPPLKLEKTGRPTEPKSRYRKTEMVPLREPNRMPANITAKVCMVIGTPRGIGMDI